MKAVTVVVCLAMLIVSPVLASSKGKPKGTRYIVVYLGSQTLQCVEGDRVVYSTRTSSGKKWHAPGSKHTPRYRAEYTVLGKDPDGEKATSTVKKQKKVKGKLVTYFAEVSTPNKIILCWQEGELLRIHGFSSVPRTPKSNGCFRLTLVASRKVFAFAEVGMKVKIMSGKTPKAKHVSAKTAHRHRAKDKVEPKKSSRHKREKKNSASNRARRKARPRSLLRQHCENPPVHLDPGGLVLRIKQPRLLEQLRELRYPPALPVFGH